MVSTGSSSTFRERMLPATAIFRHELRNLWGSWLVRLWLAGTVLLTLLLLAGGWAELRNAPFIGSLLFPYLVFPWFLVAVVLGVSPVTGSRAEALADGILSRPVNRHEYLLASWAARVAAVLGVYLVVMVPAVLLIVAAERPVADDRVTLYGIVASLGLVGLVQAFLVSLGFLVGTLLRHPMLAVVMLVFVWYPINLILNVFALEEFSPISLNQAVPVLLRQSWSPSDDAQAAGDAEDAEAAARQAAQFLSVLSGQGTPQPKREPGFFERDVYRDFSLWRVALGYTLPTVLAIGLATAVFGWRDL